MKYCLKASILSGHLKGSVKYQKVKLKQNFSEILENAFAEIILFIKLWQH